MIEIAAARVPEGSVEFIRADVLSWRSAAALGRRFDVAFFGFWLSHVPSDRFADFWGIVADSLVDGGRAVFVDEHATEAGKESWLAREVAERRLSDGSTHRIVKTFLDPRDITTRLSELGWRADVATLGSGWVIGDASRAG